MLDIKESIPCRFLNDHPGFYNFELMAIEINQTKRKYLFIGIYKPPSQNAKEFTNILSLTIDYHFPENENLDYWFYTHQ